MTTIAARVMLCSLTYCSGCCPNADESRRVSLRWRHYIHARAFARAAIAKTVRRRFWIPGNDTTSLMPMPATHEENLCAAHGEGYIQHAHAEARLRSSHARGRRNM